MTTITITLPAEYSFVRQSTPFTIKPESIKSADIWAALALHGLTQKVGDSAAGKNPGKDATACMDATLAQLVAGEWRQRSGESIDPVTTVIRTMLRESLAAPANAKRKAEYKALPKEPVARGEYLDAWFDSLPESNADAITKAAKRKLADKAKERDAIAALLADESPTT